MGFIFRARTLIWFSCPFPIVASVREGKLNPSGSSLFLASWIDQRKLRGKIKEERRTPNPRPPSPHLRRSELSRWNEFGSGQSILWNFRIESQGSRVAESWRIPSNLCHLSNHNRTRKEIASEHPYSLLVLDLWAVSFLTLWVVYTKVYITFDQKMGTLEFIEFLFLLCLAGTSESMQSSLLITVSPLLSNATFSCLKSPFASILTRHLGDYSRTSLSAFWVEIKRIAASWPRLN